MLLMLMVSFIIIMRRLDAATQEQASPAEQLELQERVSELEEQLQAAHKAHTAELQARQSAHEAELRERAEKTEERRVAVQEHALREETLAAQERARVKEQVCACSQLCGCSSLQAAERGQKRQRKEWWQCRSMR